MRVTHSSWRRSSPGSRIRWTWPERAYCSSTSVVPSCERLSVAITTSAPAFRWNASHELDDVDLVPREERHDQRHRRASLRMPASGPRSSASSRRLELHHALLGADDAVDLDERPTPRRRSAASSAALGRGNSSRCCAPGSTNVPSSSRSAAARRAGACRGRACRPRDRAQGRRRRPRTCRRRPPGGPLGTPRRGGCWCSVGS